MKTKINERTYSELIENSEIIISFGTLKYEESKHGVTKYRIDFRHENDEKFFRNTLTFVFS